MSFGYGYIICVGTPTHVMQQYGCIHSYLLHVLFALLVFIEVSLSLGFASYEFGEDIGAAQLELTLDGPIECCSISVTVKVEDITAKGIRIYLII